MRLPMSLPSYAIARVTGRRQTSYGVTGHEMSAVNKVNAPLQYCVRAVWDTRGKIDPKRRQNEEHRRRQGGVDRTARTVPGNKPVNKLHLLATSFW